MPKLLYTKFNYSVQLLDFEESRSEVYTLLSSIELNKNKHRSFSLQNKDIRVLKQEIEFGFKTKYHTPLGLFKNKQLIGVCFTSLTDLGIPWLGYFRVIPELEKTKASIVFLNYIINHLYKDMKVQLGVRSTKKLHKRIRSYPAPLSFSVLKSDTINKLKYICKD